MGWVIGVVVVGLVLWLFAGALRLDQTSGPEALVIAVASGVIAAVAMLPSLRAVASRPAGETGSSRPQGEAANRWSGISAAVMAGTVIRMVGTVALFLTCRYHMASTTEMIVAMTIGWYVLLTSIEVIVLGRVLPDVAGRSGHLVAPKPLKV